MDLDDIYVVTDRLETASAADVTRAEHQLGCRFPTGYAEYVQRLGRGSLNDLLRVMLPGRIVAELRDWRATWLWTESWFWDNPESAVDQDRVLGAVPLGDTETGDQLWFHPDDPDTVIFLPRDFDRSYAVGPGLDGAIDWVFSSGVLQPPGGPSAFHSHVGRKYVRHESQTRADVASARDALLALGTHALVDQFHDDHCVVYFPSIKGRVVLMALDGGDVDALIVHDDGVAPSSLTVIQTALERAGFPFSYSWG